MKRTALFWNSFLALTIIFLIVLLAWKILPGPATYTSPTILPTSTKNFIDQGHVSRVIDGDTIVLSDGRTVRYIGVDTPEINKLDPQISCFADEAAQKNKELVENKDITLEKDVSETDRYGRLLRYVFIEEGLSINLYLVREGYARAKDYPPDSEYKELFLAAENQAKVARKGLWGKC